MGKKTQTSFEGLLLHRPQGEFSFQVGLPVHCGKGDWVPLHLEIPGSQRAGLLVILLGDVPLHT